MSPTSIAPPNLGGLYSLTEREIDYEIGTINKGAWLALNDALQFYSLPPLRVPDRFVFGRRVRCSTKELTERGRIHPDLVKMINKPLTLDSPFTDFLLVAGWNGYRDSSYYQTAAPQLKREIDNYAYLKDGYRLVYM